MIEAGLENVAVIGAAGKMGNGIALVLLEAMAKVDAGRNGVPGSGPMELVLIDRDWDGLKRLRGYLEAQLLKFAEKNISALREWSRPRRDLIENEEIINAFVKGALSMTRYETHVDGAKKARLVFEAVFEDVAIKTELYTQLAAMCSPETFFLSNTSSIPISVLDQLAKLNGRIIGFHFYNPPAVQKLVEVISGAETRPELVSLAKELGKGLGKTLVFANDIAGFIGNGHFIREGLFALEKYGELRKSWDEAESVLMINAITQDFLIRPMGMFQLIDYVGLEVFRMITKTMAAYITGESFACDVIDMLLGLGVKGGQAGSGEQKDGFFQYKNNRMIGVYHVGEKRYVPLTESGRFNKCLGWLGRPPRAHVAWSKLSKDSAKLEKLRFYFNELGEENTPGALLAKSFCRRSREIAEALIDNKVAAAHADVKTVLMAGFFHLYGPMETGF